MCEDMNGEHPYHAARAEQLQELCSQLGLDAILLITGWDGCYNLGARGLVEWLCDKAGSALSATELEGALEEGLFVITPERVEYHVANVADDAQMDEAAAAAPAAGEAALGGIGNLPAGGLANMHRSDPMQISPPPSLVQQQPCCLHAAAAVSSNSSNSGSHHQHHCSNTSSSGSTGGGISPAAEAATAGNSNMLAGQATAAAAAAAGSVVTPPAPDAKLSLLLHMRGSLRRTGLPLGVEVLHGVQQQVNSGSIHKWPLLMALAELAAIQPEQLFEDIVDISPDLPALMGVVDGTHLYNVLCVRRPLLHRAWTEVMAACWRRSSGPKLDISEAAIAAPLTEFVSGCGCRLKPGQYMPLALPPRVLFGLRTGQLDALSSSAATLRALSSQHGSAVLHATVEGSDACSALRFARTVFFAQGNELLRQQQLGGEAAGQSQSLTGGEFEVDQVDVFDLMAWYCCAVDAAWAAMQHMAAQPNATWESTQAAAEAAAVASAASAQLPAPTFSPASSSPAASVASETADGMALELPDFQEYMPPRLKLQFSSWSGGPRPMPQQPQQQQHNMRFKTVRVLCSGIYSRSRAHAGLLLGAVLYSDTFLDVPAMGSSPAQLINLTATHCPFNSFSFWGCEAAENTQLVAAFRRHLQQQLQQQLQAAAQAQLAQAIQAQVQAQAQAQTQRRKSIDNPVGVAGSTTAAAAAVEGGKGAAPAAAGGTTSAACMGPSPVAAAALRRPSLPQQDQLLLLQQHFQQQQQTASGQGNMRKLFMLQEQQVLQLQQQQQLLLQQLAAAGGQQQARKQQASLQQQLLGQVQQQQQQSNGKHVLTTAAGPADTSLKRSCCGGGSSTTAAAAAGTPAGVHWGLSSPVRSAGTPPPLLPPSGSMSAAASPQKPGPAAGGSSSSSNTDCTVVLQQLGQLLLPQGEMPGEIGLVFTGARRLAVMDGPLYPHQHGLAFISRPSKVHILLMEHVEGVWLQDFASKLPGYAAVGPCLVLKGRASACGLVPAMHMTENTHLAIPLRSMSKVCREHWVSTVLPAWQAATGRIVEARGASAPWPLPAELHPVYRYWLQGPRKRFMVLQPDESVEALIHAMDKPQQEQHPLMYHI